jgi:tetratricopeptide (TPR) repeat protein
LAKAINIAIGIVVVALVASLGLLLYLHFKPATGESGQTSLERTYKKWKEEVDKNPDNSFARANLAATLADMDKNDDAIKEFKTAIDQEPKNFEYMYKLGLIYRKVGKLDSALDLFMQASELSPKGSKYAYQFEAAETAMEKGDIETAKDYCERSIKDNDMIWNSHSLLGKIYEQQGDLAKAKEEYQKAASFNPTDPELQDALKRLAA